MSNLFKFSKSAWGILKDKKVFETPIFSLHQLSLDPENQESTHPFYILNAPEWINIIALTPDDDIVLVEQYRAGIHDVTLEIPGGMVDGVESPLESAKRELLEETGFASSDWEFLGKTSSNPAILSNFTHLFLAKNCKQVSEQQPDGSEDIKIHKLQISKFFELVQNGTIHHAIVLAAVSKFLLHTSFKNMID